MRTTKLIMLRVRGKAAAMCGRSLASAGRSTSTKPASSAPAARQIARSQAASRMRGAAGMTLVVSRAVAAFILKRTFYLS